ncbi:MAG: UvrD-helicase domain-containing protein [Gammaproteobacteria bacterium]|nr:UvrD-helicase domain-containing protein [Gammaproteobacteria bacterium]
MRFAVLRADDAAVRDELADRFRYLLIDEYQDTNHAQYVIASQLATGHRNICATGDPDQSIYAWRGADIRNILDFEADYPEAMIVRLSRLRSTGDPVGGVVFDRSQQASQAKDAFYGGGVGRGGAGMVVRG